MLNRCLRIRGCERVGVDDRRHRDHCPGVSGAPFYDLPAEHWRHLRTTNPIESSLATVKLRTKVTKSAGSKKAALAMAYKLLDAA